MTDNKAALDAFRRIHGWSLGKAMYDNVTEDFYLVEKALTTTPAPTVMGDDVREAAKRISEFVRQRSTMRGIDDIIYIVHSDSKTKEAALKASDLETLIRAATAPKNTDAEREKALEDLKNNAHAFRNHGVDIGLKRETVETIKAALQSPAVPIWKPIETAPHNRTLLLTFNFQSVYAGHYDGDGVWLDQNWEVPKPTHWSEFPISEQALALLGGKEG